MSNLSELNPGSFEEFCRTTDLIGSDADLLRYFTAKAGNYKTALIGVVDYQPKQSIDLPLQKHLSPNQFHMSLIPDVQIENVD